MGKRNGKESPGSSIYMATGGRTVYKGEEVFWDGVAEFRLNKAGKYVEVRQPRRPNRPGRNGDASPEDGPGQDGL